jgi:hypothetical protein
MRGEKQKRLIGLRRSLEKCLDSSFTFVVAVVPAAISRGEIHDRLARPVHAAEMLSYAATPS